MGGPRAVLLCIKLLFEVGPKLRLLARLARLLSRSPVSILAPCGSTTELPAGCITSPNNAAPAPAETGPELEGCPKALLKSETKALDPDDVVPKPSNKQSEVGMSLNFRRNFVELGERIRRGLGWITGGCEGGTGVTGDTGGGERGVRGGGQRGCSSRSIHHVCERIPLQL